MKAWRSVCHVFVMGTENEEREPEEKEQSGGDEDSSSQQDNASVSRNNPVNDHVLLSQKNSHNGFTFQSLTKVCKDFVK